MTTPTPPSSRLEALWANHEEQTRRLDDLERRMEENVTRKRRRIANLLDELPTHRRSHMRVFVTHNKNFTLIIEGKLLVGHLDHSSMKTVEREAAAEARLSVDPEEEGGAVLTRSTDQTLFRGKDENEGDVPVEKVAFTHFFDRLQVDMQTVFQKPQLKDLMSPKKTSRSKPKKPVATAVVDIKSLSMSPTKEYVWMRENTGDASAWFVKYSPMTPPQGQIVHSVVATIKLWPRPGNERLFKPAPALAAALFPDHAPVAQKKKSKKKPDEKEGETIPLDNDIVIPSSLTSKEIFSAIYHYVQMNNLTDENEPSVIVNDKALASLFHCDRMNFADVQQLLVSKQLVTDVTREPTVITYVMTKGSATPSLGEPPIPDHIPQCLSFDTDVYVEGVFHVRVRDLLRRIKRREFEYTSARTPARNMLCTSRANTDVVNRRIEEAVVGRGYTPEHVPIWLALAKSAPPRSEARVAAQIDAKMCTLLERLEHHSRAAQAAWDVVDACRGEST